MTDSTQLREQIEHTRSNLSADVNTLADSVKPANIARRKTERVRGRFSSVVDSVMGKKDALADRRDAMSGQMSGHKDQLTGKASDLTSQTGSALSGVGDTITSAPGAVRHQTQGNPLAAGVIALGIGWLAGSMLPSSQREQHAAMAVKEKALPVVKDAGTALTDNLREPATEALSNVKSAASDAAATVQQEGTSQVQDLKSSASDAKDEVQSARSGG